MKKTLMASLNKYLADFAKTLDIFIVEHLVSCFTPKKLQTLFDQLGIDDSKSRKKVS